MADLVLEQRSGDLGQRNRDLAQKNRTLELHVGPAELEQRKAGWTPKAPNITKGVLGKYTRLVRSASEGAVCI